MLDLRDEMERQGVPIEVRPIVDGEIHRFHVPGQARGKKNGWYVFNEQNGKLYGAFGDWKSGIRGTVGGADARRVVRQVLDSKQAAIDARAERAAIRATMEWSAATDERLSDNPYLTRKMVPGYGVKAIDDVLIVPMRKGDAMVGLQKIFADGQKRFTPGCKKLGSYHLLGPLPRAGQPLLVAEGYATGASLHLATSLPVLVAFDCGNILPAARSAKELGVTRFIWAADNDAKTEGNPGLTKAKTAAKELGGKVIAPLDVVDFNDLHVASGIMAVADAVYDSL